MDKNNLEELDLLVQPEKSKADKIIDTILEMIDAMVLAIFAMILLFTFLIRIISVKGPSMNNTLYNKDVLLLSSFMYEPKCGDIVVIESSVFGDTIIKRIIATEGQTLEIDYDAEGGCVVTVDGAVIDEPYIKEPMREMQDFSNSFYNPQDTIYRYEVPRGCVFVMGDNRNSSTDSRTIGFIDENEIVGKIVFRMYSPDASIGKVK